MPRLVGIFTVFLCASISDAAIANEPTNEDRSRALFTQAADLYDTGDKAGALRLFQESYALVPRAKTLLNIGVVLSEVGRTAESANALERYVNDPDADRDRVPKAAALLAKLDAQLLLLELDVKRSGSISLDGQRIGDGPLARRIRVAPGTHIVAVAEEQRDVVGNSGESVAVAFEAPQVQVPEPREGLDASDRSIVSHPALWTGIIAVAAAGVGGGFGLASRAAEKDFDEINANSGDHTFFEARDLADRAEQRALIANVAFGVAAAAALTTVVLALVIDGDGNGDGNGEAETVLNPIATPTTVGLGVSARF